VVGSREADADSYTDSDENDDERSGSVDADSSVDDEMTASEVVADVNASVD
jgi:hypothetical protein